MVLLFLLAAFAASAYTLGKSLMEYSTPMFVVGMRMLLSGIFLYGYYHIKHKPPRLVHRDYITLLKIAFFGFCLPYILEFTALQYMTGAKTAFLYSLSPIIGALLSYHTFGEKLTSKKIAGILIAFAGFIPELILTPTTVEGYEWMFISLPELTILAAVLCFCYSWTLVRKTVRKGKLPIPFINGIGMLAGGAMALVLAYIKINLYDLGRGEGWMHPLLPIKEFWPFTGLMLLLVFFGSIAYLVLYSHLLKKYSSTVLTFGDLLAPLFAAFYGWLFLGETVPWYFYLSMALLLSGMSIFYFEEKKLGYIKE